MTLTHVPGSPCPAQGDQWDAHPSGRIVVVCGPTASGKTALAVALAQVLDGEVVSADSMQIYRRMDIGTAKPTPQEQAGIPHHMLDVAEPEESFSVARYVEMATPIVDHILARGRVPIVAGGTGLYLDHLVAGRQFAPFPEDGRLRARLQQRAAQEGLDQLRAELALADPDSAARLHPHDEKRILRALEVWLATGKTLTRHNQDSQALPPRYRTLTLRLDFQNRETLWERINRRVDDMMERGLADEVRLLLDSGLNPHCTAMQAIGYKELAAALQTGSPLQPAVELVKLRSRQYSKRQRTWFARNRDAHVLLWENIPDISAAVEISTQLAMDFGVR